MNPLPTSDRRSRHVSFASKCLVIPWTEVEEDNLAEDTLKQRATEHSSKRRRRLRLNVFRSLSSSGRHQHSGQEGRSGSRSPAKAGEGLDKRASGTLSPSLPINKDLPPIRPLPTSSAEKMRRKLISPPPPSALVSMTPMQHRVAQAADQSLASTSQRALNEAAPSLSKPIAVRKPLVLGADSDLDVAAAETTPAARRREEEGEGEEGGAVALRVPAVVAVHTSPQPEQGEAHVILNWTEEGEESDDEDEEGEDDGVEMLEEDLNGDCVCLDCESQMLAALSQTYAPPWTRAARRKYLADRKQAQMEGAKKTLKLPSWLRSDGDDEDEGQRTSTTARDIRADEVDSKRGTTRVAVVPIQSGTALASPPLEMTDASLRDEVNQELRLRREEEQSKQSRSEMKMLSNDSSSGLRSCGGGARAMMRQLEEAERIEKRASVQRSNSRSPSSAVEEQSREERRPMGAVKETVVRPFTSPRRLSEHTLSPPSMNGKGGTSSTPRTPSPLQQQILPSQQNQQRKKNSSPSKDEAARPNRHPSPSLLIRRELALGIPVHSNLAGARTSWPAHPPTRTPSPGLASPTTLEDIAEVPSASITELASGGGPTPRRANTIGHASQMEHSRRAGAANGAGSLNRSSSLSSKQTALSNQRGNGSGLGLNLSNHAHSSEGRLGQAKHKARSSLKDLVARIKS